MGLIEEDINTMLVAQVGKFQSAVYRQIMGNLKDTGISITGEMERKIKVGLETINSKMMASVVLEFPEYAALTQARRYYAKNASVDELAEWVLSVGLDKFRYVPGYETGTLPSQDRQARRIAYGIKNYKGATRKRNDIRQWLHKPFFQMWAMYRDEVIEKQFDIIRDRTHQILEDALNGEE